MIHSIEHIAVPIVLSLIASGSAADLSFSCEWQNSEPTYKAVFEVDLEKRTATRSDSAITYFVAQINNQAVWLSSAVDGLWMENIQIITRGTVGGKWTDVILFADGSVAHASGGYCIEVERAK